MDKLRISKQVNSYHKCIRRCFSLESPISASRMRASCGNQGSSTLTKPEHALCHTSTLPLKSGIILRPSGSWESPRTGSLRLWAAPSPVSAGSFPVTGGFPGLPLQASQHVGCDFGGSEQAVLALVNAHRLVNAELRVRMILEFPARFSLHLGQFIGRISINLVG